MKKNKTKRSNNKKNPVVSIFNNEKKNETKQENKSIVLKIDEATEGIMKEIQTGITDEIIESIQIQERKIKDLDEKLDRVFKLERENKKLLEQILKQMTDNK